MRIDQFMSDFLTGANQKAQNLCEPPLLPHSPQGVSGYCFHPWCPDGRAVGKSLSGLYLRNRKG